MEELRPLKIKLERPTANVLPVGVGAFGKVYGVCYNGAPCIAKSLHKILMGLGTYEAVPKEQTKPLFTKFVKECVIHSKLRHPNIVQFIGVEYGGDPDTDLHLVMERMDNNLESCLEAVPNGIPLVIKLSILRDVSAGLLYLHSFNPPIIHGDLTMTNILLTHDWKAKIADFGNSVDQSILSTAPGALIYMPPEALVKPLRYDTKLDIFSFGTVSLFTSLQVKACDYDKREELIRRLSADQQLTCMYQIVTWCCEKDQTKRPSSMDLNTQLQKLCPHDTQFSNMKQMVNNIFSDDFEKERKDRNRLAGEKVHLMEQLEDTKQELAAVKGKMECLHTELMGTRKELSDAKEEIAVKVAQVKQYQNQVEAYKHQLEQAESAEKDNLLIASLEKELRAVKKENEMLSNDVDAFKASLIKFGKTNDRHPETQVTIAKAESANRLLKEKNETLLQHNLILKEERDKYESDLIHLRTQLHSVKENLNAMETLMQRQLKVLNTQLNEAKEEIAVKVAQVKQYQKQVEAYKQQLEQGTYAGPPPHSVSTHVGLLLTTCTEVDCAAGGQGIGTAHRPSLDSTIESIILPAPTSFPPSSVTDTPRPPISDPPAQCREPVAVSASHRVPDAHTPPLADQPDLDDLPPPLVIVRPQGTVSPASHSRPYHEEYGKSADFVVPPDPNLTCPHCHIVFRKGEIQRFRQHVQECKHPR